MARRKFSTEIPQLPMTPMIDCTFQLIIFFVVCTQSASEAYSYVQICRPLQSQAEKSDTGVARPNSMVINVLSKDPDAKDPDPALGAQAACYEIMKRRTEIGDTQSLELAIKETYAAAKAMGQVREGDPEREFYLEIRADKKVSYDFVAPVIKAGVQAGVSRMKLTALVE